MTSRLLSPANNADDGDASDVSTRLSAKVRDAADRYIKRGHRSDLIDVILGAVVVILAFGLCLLGVSHAALRSDIIELRRERDELRAEVADLRVTVTAQAARIAQLEGELEARGIPIPQQTPRPLPAPQRTSRSSGGATTTTTSQPAPPGEPQTTTTSPSATTTTVPCAFPRVLERCPVS